MNKYLATLIFYVAAFLIIYVLNLISPGAPDGGLGLGSIGLILLLPVILVLIGVCIYKGIKKSKDYFILAIIHAAMLLGVIAKFFI